MADTWREILASRKKHADFKRSMEKKRNRRQKLLGNMERNKDHRRGQNRETAMEVDAKLERQILECLLSPVLEMPIDPSQLAGKVSKKPPHAKLVAMVLEKMAAQEFVQLQAGSNSLISLDIDRVTKIAEALGITGQQWTKPLSFSSAQEEVEWLVNAPSVRDQESRRVGTEIQDLLSAKTVKEQLMLEKFQSAGGSQLREFCPHKTREDCRRITGTRQACNKLHFRKIIQAHTDESLGDCSFLNTCFHMDTCKFVHYEIEHSALVPPPESRHGSKPSFSSSTKPATSWAATGIKSTRLNPAQWINCDLRQFDMSVLGNYAVVMADPPWDIHMELPYGTMSDNEMRQLNIPAIQEDGYIFLWVTGRAMELGRECLTLWGYERIGELIWVKTNQLQRLIRTGRTGHWLNHGKEHCLVGVKGDLKNINRGIDCDIIVAEVRATSHKPDEVYGIIERLSPGTTKIELFGRQHNCQPNWLTLGNQLNGVQIHDLDLRDRFFTRYPREEMAMLPSSTPQLMQ